MGWWNRSRTDAAASGTPATEGAPAQPSPALLAEGRERCTEKGCGATTGISCEYVDRRNRHCRTAWCPDHRIVMDDQVYCRRHAGVMGALASPAGAEGSLPDLENRAPSLASWVALELDADIRALLLDAIEPSSGAQLLVDPVCLIFVGTERRRVWQRAWKLATHAGVELRVAVQVAEASDTEIELRVGAETVKRVTPPWIAQRSRRRASAADAKRRSDFKQGLLAAAAAGVEEELARGRRVARGEQVVRDLYERRPDGA